MTDALREDGQTDGKPPAPIETGHSEDGRVVRFRQRPRGGQAEGAAAPAGLTAAQLDVLGDYNLYNG